MKKIMYFLLIILLIVSIAISSYFIYKQLKVENKILIMGNHDKGKINYTFHNLFEKIV